MGLLDAAENNTLHQDRRYRKLEIRTALITGTFAVSLTKRKFRFRFLLRCPDMSPPQASQDLYLHVRVVISIIVGLCITTLLNGFARFVQHPRRARVSILHLGWAASLLLWIIHFWWWEFRLALIEQWTFAIYFFIILYAILFYFLCTLLFPSDLQDYSGYEEYFLSRRYWFFGILAATFIADIVDTNLKGSVYLHSLGIEYPIRISVGLVVCCIALFTRNRRVQLTLLAVSLLYQVFYILRLYSTE